MGFSWVGWLNILLLQWFFVRLQVSVDDDGTVLAYHIIGWILPLTGWFVHNDYIGLGKQWRRRL